MHCQRQNNYFEWTSGSPVLYTNWAVREPNNAGVNEDCVMVYDVRNRAFEISPH